MGLRLRANSLRPFAAAATASGSVSRSVATPRACLFTSARRADHAHDSVLHRTVGPVAMSNAPAAAPRVPGLPDLIVLTQLEVRMLVGVDNWERSSPQPVRIDAIVHTDISAAGRTDHLPYSLHYGTLTKALEKHCAHAHYRSFEALAVRFLPLVIYYD